MEEIKSCRNCGARLLEHEKYCPVCGMVQEDKVSQDTNIDTNEMVFDPDIEENIMEKKNYWKSPIIWSIAIVLLVVSIGINGYIDRNPIEVVDSNKQSEDEYNNSSITINGQTDKYAQATNNNMLGISYVNKDKAYIMMSREMLVYDKTLNNRELVFDQYMTSFSEDKDYYYFLDENNDYLRVDKKTKKDDVLLSNVYYVQNLGEKVYYQKDNDNESIHCLDVAKNEDKKINDEVSYSLIIDEKKERIFYINKNAELISTALDGSDRKALASNTHIYTYDGEYLYYINDKGVVRCDLNGNHQDIYDNFNLKMINIVDDHIVVHDGNVIYTMDLNGKKVKKLYTIEATGELTFEVIGDKLLVLALAFQEQNIGYEIIGLDGKRHILENNTPSIIGEEI
ncbi:zinc ribbon domain-containing protein [Thomasclavelia cocleata]|uniref:Prolow-density lipoprotein receptor-related protein 1-like beta-propeller domain-containing protein n=1 Tax=Thomasclavelia cocleata TaxID=69824 RepID=A0A1I0GHT7_9FIRM|nr:zinc ribbon domain-containing protein [Thomasclavelia cocleata]MCR1961353.1 DUF5050 domain-containing protein [Thomasclavelia cocleata]NDO41570.1 DUF5050 domain-containing protein [Thomasclavelia cocleata]PJN81309.1 zinc ribbon domain-containing protein [Thomasclavelia cocleata]SET70502.1 protein of unknown function [Thomasclavelia cocleata]